MNGSLHFCEYILLFEFEVEVFTVLLRFKVTGFVVPNFETIVELCINDYCCT